MKANELMIGDFATRKNYENKTVVCKIIGLSKNSISVEFDNGSRSMGASEDSITPIPLTTEILESNQFVHGYGDSDFYDYEKWEKIVNDKTIRVIKDSSGWFCRVDDKTMTRSMGIAPFVHIVQHILRIGGVEYEIKL